jgi:hypothetical protein
MCAQCGCGGAIPRAEPAGFADMALSIAPAVASTAPPVIVQDRFPWWLVVLAVALLLTHK